MAVRPSRVSSPVKLASPSLSRPCRLRPVVDGAGERRAQAGQVRAAVRGVDGVGEGEDRFVVAVVVLDGGLDQVAFDLLLDIDRLVQHRAVLVQIANEAPHAALEVEGHPARAVVGALVAEFDGQAAVQERHLAETLLQRLEAEVSLLEDRLVGQKVVRVPVVPSVTSPIDLDIGLRHAALIALAMDLAARAHLHLQPVGERVDRRDAHAVQAAGHLVGAAAEFAAGMQLGHHRFQRRPAGLLVDAHGDAAAPVLHGDAAVFVDGDLDAVAVAGHRFVDGVVHDLVDHVVQRLDVGAADVHARATPHRLQPFKHLDVVCCIVIRDGLFAQPLPSLPVYRPRTTRSHQPTTARSQGGRRCWPSSSVYCFSFTTGFLALSTSRRRSST